MKTVIAAIALSLTFAAQAQQMSSYAECRAKVPCYGMDPYGRQVIVGEAYCVTYGSSWVNGSGDVSASCTWKGQFGVGVECTGYTQVRDAYGRIGWAWQTLSSYCRQ